MIWTNSNNISKSHYQGILSELIQIILTPNLGQKLRTSDNFYNQINFFPMASEARGVNVPSLTITIDNADFLFLFIDLTVL